MSIKPTASKPLYMQLEDILCQNINSGKLPQGSKLPTEIELCQMYHVSRITIRSALKKLADAGYLERHSGRGTFVTEAKVQKNLGKVIGFTEMCVSQHMQPGAKTLKIELTEPTVQEQDYLQLKPGAQILLLQRLRSADCKPVILETVRFPESFSFLFGTDLTNLSLYQVLREHDIKFDQSSRTIDIVPANSHTAKLLEVSRDHPLLRIRSIVSSPDSQHRYLGEQLCRSDRFKIKI